MISILWDTQDVARWSGLGVEKATARALKRAGGDAIKAMRAEGKRAVRERKKIRAGYLAEKSMPLTLPKGNRIAGMEWTLRVSGKPVPLGEFPRRQMKAGVRVTVNVGKTKLIKSAFLAMTKSGRMGVFLRPTDARFPMGHKLGSNVAETFSDKPIIARVQMYGQDSFRSRFMYWMPLEVAKL